MAFIIGGGLLLGAGLMAGGSVAGGILGAEGGLSAGDMVNPAYDPMADFTMQASGFDSRLGSGFARPDLLLRSGPMNEMISRINGLSIDEKSKRRALVELNNLVLEREGRDLQFGERFPRELEGVLARIGMTTDGLGQLFADQSKYEQSIQPLLEQYGVVQEDVVRNRMQAALGSSIASAEAGRQLEAAAGFAAGGQPQNALQAALLQQDNRNMANAMDRLGVLANFGNINPGTLFEQGLDMQMNQNLRLLQQSLEASGLLAQNAGGLSQSTALGNAQIQQANATQNQAQTNAAQIAAQQAMATNQIRNQTSLDNALSMANGISGAANALGQGFMGGAQAFQNQSQFNAQLSAYNDRTAKLG